MFAGDRTPLSPILRPVEHGLYRLAGIDPAKEQGWLAYCLAMLAFNGGFALLYAILRAQAFLPLNPLGFPGMSADLAFNTAVSFVTNTNWQSYGGETTLSPFSQMAGLTVQNFLSAAMGIAVALAVRAFARSGAAMVGNFFVDTTRAVLYVLLPLAIVTGLAQVAMGTPQTFETTATVRTLEGADQTLALGPVASQLAIKQLGTNGGGYYNANSAHPYENPSPLSNALTIWQMLVVSVALVFAFGRLIGDRRQAVAILSVMGLLLVTATAVCYWAKRRERRFSRRPVSIPRAATWRARKSASASPPPASSPPSPRACRTAR